MGHDTFILALCCLIALCFTMAVIALFALLYAIIGNVWVALLATLLISALAIPAIFKLIDKIK